MSVLFGALAAQLAQELQSVNAGTSSFSFTNATSVNTFISSAKTNLVNAGTLTSTQADGINTSAGSIISQLNTQISVASSTSYAPALITVNDLSANTNTAPSFSATGGQGVTASVAIPQITNTIDVTLTFHKIIKSVLGTYPIGKAGIGTHMRVPDYRVYTAGDFADLIDTGTIVVSVTTQTNLNATANIPSVTLPAIASSVTAQALANTSVTLPSVTVTAPVVSVQTTANVNASTLPPIQKYPIVVSATSGNAQANVTQFPSFEIQPYVVSGYVDNTYISNASSITVSPIIGAFSTSIPGAVSVHIPSVSTTAPVPLFNPVNIPVVSTQSIGCATFTTPKIITVSAPAISISADVGTINIPAVSITAPQTNISELGFGSITVSVEGSTFIQDATAVTVRPSFPVITNTLAASSLNIDLPTITNTLVPYPWRTNLPFITVSLEASALQIDLPVITTTSFASHTAHAVLSTVTVSSPQTFPIDIDLPPIGTLLEAGLVREITAGVVSSNAPFTFVPNTNINFPAISTSLAYGTAHVDMPTVTSGSLTSHVMQIDFPVIQTTAMSPFLIDADLPSIGVTAPVPSTVAILGFAGSFGLPAIYTAALDANTVIDLDLPAIGTTAPTATASTPTATLVQPNFLVGTETITHNITVVNGKYVINNYVTPTLTLARGATYVFNYPSSAPLRFSNGADGTHNSGLIYEWDNYSNVGNSFTITPTANDPATLYYYNVFGSGFGGQLNIQDTVVNAVKTVVGQGLVVSTSQQITVGLPSVYLQIDNFADVGTHHKPDLPVISTSLSSSQGITNYPTGPSVSVSAPAFTISSGASVNFTPITNDISPQRSYSHVVNNLTSSISVSAPQATVSFGVNVFAGLTTPFPTTTAITVANGIGWGVDLPAITNSAGTGLDLDWDYHKVATGPYPVSNQLRAHVKSSVVASSVTPIVAGDFTYAQITNYTASGTLSNGSSFTLGWNDIVDGTGTDKWLVQTVYAGGSTYFITYPITVNSDYSVATLGSRVTGHPGWGASNDYALIPAAGGGQPYINKTQIGGRPFLLNNFSASTLADNQYLVLYNNPATINTLYELDISTGKISVNSGTHQGGGVYQKIQADYGAYSPSGSTYNGYRDNTATYLPTRLQYITGYRYNRAVTVYGSGFVDIADILPQRPIAHGSAKVTVTDLPTVACQQIVGGAQVLGGADVTDLSSITVSINAIPKINTPVNFPAITTSIVGKAQIDRTQYNNWVNIQTTPLEVSAVTSWQQIPLATVTVVSPLPYVAGKVQIADIPSVGASIGAGKVSVSVSVSDLSNVTASVSTGLPYLGWTETPEPLPVNNVSIGDPNVIVRASASIPLVTTGALSSTASVSTSTQTLSKVIVSAPTPVVTTNATISINNLSSIAVNQLAVITQIGGNAQTFSPFPTAIAPTASVATRVTVDLSEAMVFHKWASMNQGSNPEYARAYVLPEPDPDRLISIANESRISIVEPDEDGAGVGGVIIVKAEDRLIEVID